MRRLILITTISLVMAAASADSDDDPEVWSGFGLFTVTPDAPVPDGYAKAITNTLVPPAAWKELGLPYADAENAKAYLIDYGDKGKLITIDRWLSLRPNVRFSLNIEKASAVPVRHQIMIGTDKADWQVLKRSSLSSDEAIFHRAYLLRQKEGGAVLGIVFHGGAWSTIEWPAPSTTSQVASLEAATRSLAKELRRIYPSQVAPLARDLDDDRPVPTRPDLPNPDTQPRMLNAEKFAG